MSETLDNPQPILKETIRENGTKKVVTIHSPVSLTQQHQKDQCDVNKIMARYKKTGSITHLRNAQQGVYADLTKIPDYQTALHQVMNAQAAFEQIPAHIRNRFNHDPAQLIAFLSDNKNRDEAIKLGLLPKPETTPGVVEITHPPKDNNPPKTTVLKTEPKE